MGIARRIADIYEAKVNALLDRAEDPREMLDYSYSQQQEFVRRMRAAVCDIAASRKLAEAQEAEVRSTAKRLGAQAEQAVAAGQDDLGRDALRLRADTVAHADDLAATKERLRADEQQLTAAARRLESRVEEFRYQKEALKAAYTAAQARAGRPDDGFWDAREVGEATRRAEDQTAALRARAEVLGEMIGSDVSEAALPTSPPDARRIQERLDDLSTQAAVEKDLARIKKRLATSRGGQPSRAKRPSGTGHPPGAQDAKRSRSSGSR